jgi:hypothetical protein
MLAPPTPTATRTINPGAAAKPFSIRLTDDERQFLSQRAGDTPLAAYIRDLVLGQHDQAVRRRSKQPVKDHEALARVLAALGQSHLANNLSQLAKAVHIGALPVTPETAADISAACAAILAIRNDLMRALGLPGGDRR